jgi:Fur family transcriptional regulator, ferric uptake regulator
MTDQRRDILSLIETANKHLYASQILRKAQKLNPSVDRSTVYRTLGILKRQGMIDELDLMHLQGEGRYYERKLGRDHVHIACLSCETIREFVSERFAALKRRLEQECRFHILVARPRSRRILLGVPPLANCKPLLPTADCATRGTV